LEIIVVGTGNVAFQMALRLMSRGVNITGIIGRNKTESKRLASLLQCQYSTDVNAFKDHSKIYLIAVSDNAIKSVAKKITDPNATIIHTSGSTELNILPSTKKGVLWPLYSISKSAKINWNDVPVIMESSDRGTTRILNILTKALGGDVYRLDGKQRAHAHMLAVFINNFSQHFFYLLGEHQKQLGLNPKMYDDILQDTLSRIGSGELKESQTGPARRKDNNVIKKHLTLLDQNPVMKKLYKQFTDSIMETYHGEKL
jgi:predicted short-subunit dehydrogenase-like oxidoreductase (DUF2520 family)